MDGFCYRSTDPGLTGSLPPATVPPTTTPPTATPPPTDTNRAPKDSNGFCPPGYYPEFQGYAEDGVTPIYSEDCVAIQESGPSDGDGGDVTKPPTNPPQCEMGEYYDWVQDRCVPYQSPPSDDDQCGENSIYIEGYGCYRFGTGDKGASGGFVKKGHIKKYQTGGITDFTRDPRTGGAVNPADGYNFGFAMGGIAALPEYQAGGKLLRGAGDGMSDDIPAVIRGKGVQRAALADGEFVIPADVVSHLGNGSTEAGAKKLYQMMARIRKARTGKSKQAPAVNVDRYLPR